MDRLSPFLIGGPAFSGTTLLTLLLDGPDVVCLDEPDFAKPEQVHRNIPLLQRRFPHLTFPDSSGRKLSPVEELAIVRTCAEVLAPPPVRDEDVRRDLRHAGRPVPRSGAAGGGDRARPS
jgi:hypothetical protein